MTQSLSRRRVLGLAAMPLATLLSPMAQGKDRRMRVFITGSTDGLGRDAARSLIDEGHQVVLHARSKQRASALADLAPRAAGVAIGDLASAATQREIDAACRDWGFFQAVGHGIDERTIAAPRWRWKRPTWISLPPLRRASKAKREVAVPLTRSITARTGPPQALRMAAVVSSPVGHFTRSQTGSSLQSPIKRLQKRFANLNSS